MVSWVSTGLNLGQGCPKTAGFFSVLHGRRRRRPRSGNLSNIILLDNYPSRIAILVEKTFFSGSGTGPCPKCKMMKMCRFWSKGGICSPPSPFPPPGEGAGVGGFFVREIFVYILFNVRNAGAGRGITRARRELSK